MQYKTLNDAADNTDDLNLDEGSTEIWYQKREFFGEFSFGMNADLIDTDNLSKTHTLLGKVCESDPERLFASLQGENWSPNGEARDLVSGLGIHTSMSVGDIVINHEGVWMVDSMGFKCLKGS